MKKHCSGVVDNPNGLSKNYEVHIFLPNSKKASLFIYTIINNHGRGNPYF